MIEDEADVNRRIGNYRIVRPLGRGGMGAVYEVEHVNLKTHHALKTFTVDHGKQGFLRERFFAEGRALARLKHDNLVHVFDLDVDSTTGEPYFVMDLVLYKDGEPHTLADIEEGGVDEDTLVRWYVELVDALRYVHAQGIVHRDVKLNNILLTADRHVMLSDFGVSRFLGRDICGELEIASTMSDASGGGRLVLGTAGYIAPEVKRGEAATPAADFYALGMVFYRLLTGMWYEPHATALHLLDDFDYNWNQVLPLLLSEDPAARKPYLPTRTSSVATISATPKRRLPRHLVWFALALGVAGVIAAACWLGVRRGTVAQPGAVNDEDAFVQDAYAIPASVK